MAAQLFQRHLFSKSSFPHFFEIPKPWTISAFYIYFIVWRRGNFHNANITHNARGSHLAHSGGDTGKTILLRTKGWRKHAPIGELRQPMLSIKAWCEYLPLWTSDCVLVSATKWENLNTNTRYKSAQLCKQKLVTRGLRRLSCKREFPGHVDSPPAGTASGILC